ncbi:hypothetical protein DY000_02012295 [Brassica cretica]|uniref:RNase H type-1 domain-containing protein n=1 Tax=Brassica cretica TaxID=69181 RepID=A0ABQ7D1J6_BRACR|nr:hypothetical protein DY000_02012295 [Brassica cretica]
MDPASLLRKAEEESNIWFELNYPDARSSAPSTSLGTITPSWKAPTDDILKCNIAASWSESSRNSGASWIVRNCRGKVLMHGRRSFSSVQSRELAELLAIYWAIESMNFMRKDKIIFESSCERARSCFLTPSSCSGVVELVGNISQRIATSVTVDHRYQYYIASGGPNWLNDLIAYEARNAAPPS